MSRLLRLSNLFGRIKGPLLVGGFALGSLAQLTCHQALFTAPPGSTIVLIANPKSIPAHGGVSVITAIITKPTGAPAADGTVVQFFTDLGRIDEQGRTNDGVARVNLVSDDRNGKATVTGLSGGDAAAPSTNPGTTTTTVRASSVGVSYSASSGSIGAIATSTMTTVNIGTARTLHVIVTANPSRLAGSRSSHIIANVLDSDGNPVPNVSVIFRVSSGMISAIMDSGGRPIFTDNNGQAEDIVRLRDCVTVEVEAVLPDGKTEKTKVVCAF